MMVVKVDGNLKALSMPVNMAELLHRRLFRTLQDIPMVAAMGICTGKKKTPLKQPGLK